MRDFFKSELKLLKVKTGLNQYENISAQPDAANQFKILLDSLVIVCEEFTYIPDTEKKRIIQEAMIRDQDFQNFNSRVVWKWLNAKKDTYFKELAHQETNIEFPPLTGEARDKAIQEFLKAIQEAPMLQKVGGSKYDQIREQWNTNGQSNYRPLSDEEITKRELHLQYVKENYDPRTAEKLPTWIEESEWLKQQTI